MIISIYPTGPGLRGVFTRKHKFAPSIEDVKLKIVDIDACALQLKHVVDAIAVGGKCRGYKQVELLIDGDNAIDEIRAAIR